MMCDSATPWTVACQAPLSSGFYRQEHWSGLPFPPPMQEMQVQSLGREDPPEKKQRSIVARKIPWTEEPGGHKIKLNQSRLLEIKIVVIHVG